MNNLRILLMLIILPFSITSLVAYSAVEPVSQGLSSNQLTPSQSLVPIPLSPINQSPGWYETQIFVWSEVPGATSYVLEVIKPGALSCTLPSGKHSINMSPGAIQQIIQSSICHDGRCQWLESKNSIGLFPPKKPGGNVVGGACGQGDPYTYFWAVRAIGLNLPDSHSIFVSFTQP
jgi:hypothetical protein